MQDDPVFAAADVDLASTSAAQTLKHKLVSKEHQKRIYDRHMHYHHCLGATIKAVQIPIHRSTEEEKAKAWAHTEKCSDAMKKSKAMRHVLKIHKMLLQLPHYAVAQEWELVQKDASANAPDRIDLSKLPQKIGNPIYGHSDRKDCRGGVCRGCSSTIGGVKVLRPGAQFLCHSVVYDLRSQSKFQVESLMEHVGMLMSAMKAIFLHICPTMGSQHGPMDLSFVTRKASDGIGLIACLTLVKMRNAVRFAGFSAN